MIKPQEPKNNDNLIFFIGIACLVITLGTLLFALYILPFLIWNLSYDVPGFVSELMATFQDYYGFSVRVGKLLVWLVFVIPGLITGYLSYYISHLIDRRKQS
jgi:hypothetical protein